MRAFALARGWTTMAVLRACEGRDDHRLPALSGVLHKKGDVVRIRSIQPQFDLVPLVARRLGKNPGALQQMQPRREQCNIVEKLERNPRIFEFHGSARTLNAHPLSRR
jgi:hypothetical protein